jgi:hypothetical protein
MKKWTKFLRKKTKLEKLLFKIQKLRWKYLYALIPLFIIIAYFTISILRIDSERIDFLILNKQTAHSKPCHDDCLLERNKTKEEIVLAWDSNDKLFSDFKKYWQESVEKGDYMWQKELLKIALEVQDEKILVFLSDYLIATEVDDKTKANIINIYLSVLDDSSLMPYYLSILENDSMVLKHAAIKAVSSLRNKKTAFNVTDIEILEKILYDPKSSPDLKLDTFFLFLDYENYFLSQVKKVLISMYENNNDPIIRYLASERLLSLGLDNYSLPITTENDWHNYFNL